MSDYAHGETDRQLAELEKRIAAIYRDAQRDVAEKARKYFERFAERDAEQLKRLENGDITEQYYKQWRLAQIGRGERFNALLDELTARMTAANEAAVAYINDIMPSIYSLNRNYSAYIIEQVAGNVDFTLYDEQTIRRLLVEQPDSMPHYPPQRAVQRSIDLAYGKRQITAQVTQSILAGDSIKQMSDKLQQRIPDMNRTSAIRAARTAVTGAENAGRLDSYLAAEKMGIRLKKQWVATLDGRTRHSHAMLDGVIVDNNKPFDNGCMFPGDQKGPANEVYNCRCTLITDLLDYPSQNAQRRVRDPVTGKNVVVDDMTYQEWAEAKRQTGGYSGAKKTDGWEDRHAERYYEEVRNRKPYSDAKRIAKNVEDFNCEQIEAIRRHVFIDEQPRDGGLKRFDADKDQADAWQRLIDGKNVQNSDIVFLQHELYELTVMKEKGYTYEKAHEMANRVFNWQNELDKEV